jgi:hypothetical protein
MTADSYENLPRAARRRIIAWATLRSLLNATILVVAYYVFFLWTSRLAPARWCVC